MISNMDGATQKFLADLDRIQASANRAERQISSGLKVEVASDAPDAIRGILQLRAEIARDGQIQTNLSTVKANVDSADSALQTAVQVIDRAITLGTQGSGSMPTAEQRASMAQEVGGLLQQLVGLSRASVGGRYIFSGDQEESPSYALDPKGTNGVSKLITPTATRQVEDISGISFPVAMTAQDIFDAQAQGNGAAAGNVFAAVYSLQTALQKNDEAGVEAAVDSLHQASGHLNTVLGFYGAVQNRIQAATDRAAAVQVQEQADLSAQQDADVASASTQLSMALTNQQAALAARAKLPTTSLFDFLA